MIHVKKKRRINWNSVERILGDTKTRAIFSDDIMLSGNLTKCSVDDNTYMNLTALKALDEMLFANKSLVCKKTVLLIDWFCRYQAFAKVLVRYFGTVKILTEKTGLYHGFKSNMMYDLGAAVTVSSKLSKIDSDVKMIVSPDGILLSCMSDIEKVIPVMTVKPVDARLESINIINSFELNVPEKYLSSIPSNVASHKFMAAVYEYCGMRNLSDRYVTYCRYNDERMPFNEIKMKIFDI